MMLDDELSLYIHFLYCKSRCPYCDFFRKLKPMNFNEDDYVESIIDDLDRMYKLSGKRKVKSVFFGGGTPSILSDRAIGKILDSIDKYYGIKKEVEISLEANPNTFDSVKFELFNKVGINRLSLGVQALNKEGLKFLGRTHSLDDAYRAMEKAVKCFDKVSIDLIYARSGQKLEEWLREIDCALDFGLKHISLYQLMIEEGTVFYNKNIKTLGDDECCMLYQNTQKYLSKKGFERYEVSNFAVDEYNQSVHNLVYWRGGDYIGLGLGAHGRLRVDDKILALVDGKIEEELTPMMRAMELVIMGLRIKEGIDAKRFFRASKVKLFDYLCKDKLLELKNMRLLDFDENRLWLTDDGNMLMDKIIEKIVP